MQLRQAANITVNIITRSELNDTVCGTAVIVIIKGNEVHEEVSVFLSTFKLHVHFYDKSTHCRPITVLLHKSEGLACWLGLFQPLL